MSDDPERLGWAVALVVFATLGLATCVFPARGFWSSYVLDIVGPAWAYILLRGLFARNQTTPVSRFFSPERAIAAIAAVCVLVEVAQYFQLYDSHYDVADLGAYFALLVPCFIVDKHLLRKRKKAETTAAP